MTPVRRHALAHRAGMPPLRAGLIALVVLAVGVYLGFTKHIPFTHGYRLQAVFHSANLLRPGSPVRIAGVNEGKVAKVARWGHTNLAVVTMQVSDDALPIHTDATIKIRPRLFLEGNFFADINPGTPSAPAVRSGGVIPLAQTSDPVQLDQVLTDLSAPTRRDLQQLLREYGTALNARPTAAENQQADPEVRGLSGAKSLNLAYIYIPSALRYSAQVGQALTGTRPDDLSRAIGSLGRIGRALDRHEVELGDLVDNFDHALAGTARVAPALATTLRRLTPTLAHARATFADLDAAIPPTRALARELLPGVRATPATLRAAQPWLPQARGLLSRGELGGLAAALQPTSADLARLTRATEAFLPRLDDLDRCVSRVILPTGDVKVKDGPFSTGVENYKEFWYAMVGLAGEGQTFDGNGGFVRFATGGGANTIATGPSNQTGDKLYGNAIAPPLGTRPRYTGHKPPVRTDVPCYRARVPDVNGPASSGPPDPLFKAKGAK
jgi:phospholipid/cholesterol/gamma-HCH transport system substrate-binding protein